MTKMRFRKLCMCTSAAAVLACCMAACKTETSSSDPEYAVTYDANGADSGTVPSAGGKYTAGSTVSVCGNTGNLAKAGYTFAGWNTAADGTGTPYAAGGTFIMGNAAVTLYAEWTGGSVSVMVNPGDMTLSCSSTSVIKGETVTFTAALNGCDPGTIEWDFDDCQVGNCGESLDDSVSVDTSSHPSTETLTLDTSGMTEGVHTIMVWGIKNDIFYSVSARITVCGQGE